jgi:nanoRNase/pAp phosphatase (c-di-AMP/oligoRNAs hydrolase)
VEESAGVRVSVRSLEDGPALRAAERLGGGGHGRAAGAFLAREPLGDAARALRRALADVRPGSAVDVRARSR